MEPSKLRPSDKVIHAVIHAGYRFSLQAHSGIYLCVTAADRKGYTAHGEVPYTDCAHFYKTPIEHEQNSANTESKYWALCKYDSWQQHFVMHSLSDADMAIIATHFGFEEDYPGNYEMPLQLDCPAINVVRDYVLTSPRKAANLAKRCYRDDDWFPGFVSQLNNKTN